MCDTLALLAVSAFELVRSRDSHGIHRLQRVQDNKWYACRADVVALAPALRLAPALPGRAWHLCTLARTLLRCLAGAYMREYSARNAQWRHTYAPTVPLRSVCSVCRWGAPLTLVARLQPPPSRRLVSRS